MDPADVDRWVAENWSPDLTVREWWRRLADARLTAPTWPEPYGRGWSAAAARHVTEALVAVGAVAPPQGTVGVALAGPTILAHGTPEQQERYLPPLLSGEESWCQLFSEPDAGSDLPSLTTRAVDDGAGWMVTGQKVWNSGAEIARRGMLLARTDPATTGRTGISYFVLDMDQPGVEARPLRQLNDETHFCEVFLDLARVAPGELLGELHQGWHVARTTLAAERTNTAARAAAGLVVVPSGARAGWLDRPVLEAVERRPSRPAYSGYAVPARHLVALARDRGRSGDPLVRQGLARYHALVEVSRYTRLRLQAAASAGRPLGPEASITKLATSVVCRASRDLSFDVVGADGMLWGADAPGDGSLHRVALGSFGVSIGGGTDEIQRNQIAERVLGLPRDPG